MVSAQEITVFWQIGQDVFAGRAIKTSNGFYKLPDTERCVRTFDSYDEAKSNFEEVKKAEANSISNSPSAK